MHTWAIECLTSGQIVDPSQFAAARGLAGAPWPAGVTPGHHRGPMGAPSPFASSSAHKSRPPSLLTPTTRCACNSPASSLDSPPRR
eukprot:8016733-Pyramimonas_sp.AAC.1